LARAVAGEIVARQGARIIGRPTAGPATAAPNSIPQAAEQAYGPIMDPFTGDLDQAEAHVAQGRHHVARQKEIIAEFRLAGYSTTLAEQLLEAFEQTLVSHVSHRDRILAELRTH
jgi:hypothetical protein